MLPGVGQYVFISSASVYEKPPSHWMITESTPTVNPYWQYSRDKIACEETLRRASRGNRLSGDHRPAVADLRAFPDPGCRRKLGEAVHDHRPDAPGGKDHRSR